MKFATFSCFGWSFGMSGQSDGPGNRRTREHQTLSLSRRMLEEILGFQVFRMRQRLTSKVELTKKQDAWTINHAVDGASMSIGDNKHESCQNGNVFRYLPIILSFLLHTEVSLRYTMNYIMNSYPLIKLQSPVHIKYIFYAAVMLPRAGQVVLDIVLHLLSMIPMSTVGTNGPNDPEPKKCVVASREKW